MPTPTFYNVWKKVNGKFVSCACSKDRTQKEAVRKAKDLQAADGKGANITFVPRPSGQRPSYQHQV
jgi:hypothetical protein